MNFRSLGGDPCWNCGTSHFQDEVCATNWVARLTGHEDRAAGEAIHAEQWPSGEYGHADYWIGYHGGEARG